MKSRRITIYGKEIPVRDYGCVGMHFGKSFYYDEPYVNLFIQLDNRCNANCPFCVYHGEEVRGFDVEKLGRIIKYLSTEYHIGKLNFTGGEPTIDLVKFREVVDCSKENIDWSWKPEVTLNTNGLHLLDVLDYSDYFDCLGLSRHHYLDDVNREIFGCNNFADRETIVEFQNHVENKNLLQLRCNAIKGYIDNSVEIEKYLNHAIDMGVYDCGFVTLMYVNDYCLEHQIDFYEMLKGLNNTLKVNGFKRYLDLEKTNQVCECGNYVYTNNRGEFCKFYNRYFCNHNLTDGQLVYDGENLRFGFGGPVVY